MPHGTITRGTTNTNRLRRVDRWIATLPALRTAVSPLVVDLGYGASGVTAFELQHRLARVRPEVEVVGLEISPERVATALDQLRSVHAGSTGFAADAPVSFALGGFEVPLPGGRSATVIRAFNVLRQYDEAEVPAAWRRMTGRLEPAGTLVEGTCDEIGRVASWVALGVDGPQTFTLSLRLAELERPSIVAERLPKVLIHRNVDGERVHALLVELDRAWRHNAPLSVYGPRQRWVAAVRTLGASGWPVLGPAARWRLGELTLPWSSVAPRGFAWE
ncbi:class I SAM-dependent methyltransferase [Subtercola boreus]|uniref:SAM-dependent methyltransferase n=1 Tax=Subtercola boreus TaxID=120213 RepID=A0A3E0W813_9MICO|nr:class I SAM-dependent methyltransferase [Subtercola boreus]RFA19334.1 SAM-dependent methyltransferase [Subtercola boreus]RFA19595.1 SAM-dependent methyltransferase [Subtercola boreus]RFA25960.1 SAM-dependent methyltransferase [Subtercola boreus]